MRRERFQNNARLVLAVTLGLAVVFFLVEVLLRKSRDFPPDFLASVLLYGLTVLNLTLLLVLVFVLGRNLVRVLMEWRRGVLGARFRLRLLLVFLLMAIAPSLLLLLRGQRPHPQTVDRWFNVDVERMLVLVAVARHGSRRLGGRPEPHPRARSSRARSRRGASSRRAEQGRLRRADRGARPRARARPRERLRRRRRAPGGDGPPAARRRWDPDSRRGPGRGRPRRPRGRGVPRLRRRASSPASRCPCATPTGRPEGAVVVSTLPAGRGGRRGPRGPGPLHEVPQGADLPGADQGRLPLALPVSRRSSSCSARSGSRSTWRAASRRRCAWWPRAPSASPPGERGVRVDFPSGSDEFRALIASFNRMSERLARSEEEVEFIARRASSARTRSSRSAGG